MFDAINPATEEKLESYDSHSEKEVQQRLSAARDAFEDWRRVPFSQRADVLRKTANLLRERKRQYGELMTAEMGKPIQQAEAEVEKCAWVCEFYADHAEDFLAPRDIDSDAQTSRVRYDPLGPVLAIMPWNFPFWQVFRFVAPGLMAGNVGLLKHARNVPGCALAIEDVLRDAGLPAGAFATLLIPSKQVDALIVDETITAVTLTGSERAGEAVAEAAGKHLKKCVLELGGSDPFIVLADADISQAAQQATQARCQNSGQSCIAAKRFIVEQAVAEEFTERFIAEMRQQTLGDPLDEATDVGPQARGDLRDDLHEQVQRSQHDGARVRIGGEIPGGRGFFFPPTVLDRVRPGMAAFDEETFGPVAAVTVARDAVEAIDLANRTSFGLGASVWTADLARAENLAAKLEAGCVFVNQFVKSDPRLPFGGIKRSGYGRELSDYGIREFVNIKTVWIDPAGKH